MELKRFTGPDMRAALRMVREALGPDAIILSNRRTAAGVEIMAGPEEAFGNRPPATAATSPRVAPLAPAARPVACEPLASVPPPAAPLEVQAMRSELRDLRELLETRLQQYHRERLAWGPGVEGRAWRRLTRIGLPNTAVSELVEGIVPQSSWELAWAGVCERLQRTVPEAGDVVARGGVFAVVGPTGAGKTTTVCKLAVRHVLEHGNSGLALLGLDGSRLGGAEMLRAVARLLDVPFFAAQPGETVEELLDKVRDRDLVLIDTAGISRRRAADCAQLEALGALGERVHSLLVLPANAQYASLAGSLGDYRAARPVAAVITKLDETASLGETLGVLREGRLPVAYASDGPDIPDDLHVAAAAALVERALALDPEDECTRPRARAPAVAADNAARIA
jgi:flagellar biosynthesis protein FlhF